MPVITMACRCDRCGKRENTEGFRYPTNWETMHILGISRMLCKSCIELLVVWIENDEQEPASVPGEDPWHHTKTVASLLSTSSRASRK